MIDFTRLSRTEWLELAQRLFDRIEQNCASFKSSEWNRVTPYLGWRVRDVLAHMTSAMPVNFRQVLDRALAGDSSPPLLLAFLGADQADGGKYRSQSFCRKIIPIHSTRRLRFAVSTASRQIFAS